MSGFNFDNHTINLVDNFLNLAKLRETESVFQNEEAYINLKAKTSVLHPKEVPELVKGLLKLGFYQEVEFWYHELLKFDFLVPSHRDDIHGWLVTYYLGWNSNFIENDEKALEYAQKVLPTASYSEMPNDMKLEFLGDLGLAAKRLQRQDECLRYFQKRFQLYSGIKTPSNYELLLYSESLIEAQVSNKKYEAALITFSKLKIFHLNEEQCKELDKSEDLAIVKADIKRLYKNMPEAEWRKPNMGTLNNKGKLWDAIRILYRIGLLCQWKHEIYKNMCDPLPCMPLEVARTTFETKKGDPKLILYANDWLASAADIFGHLYYDLPRAVSWDLAQELIERNIYSSLQGAAYAFPDKDGNSHKILGFRHLLRFLNNFNTTPEDHERHSPYGIKYLQRSIQKYPICQEEINQFIEFFIEKSSNDEVAKSAMITFKASISINNHFKSCLQLTG